MNSYEPPTTVANRLIFLQICAAIVLTTLAYGTVHAATVGVYWTSAALIAILWTFDAFLSGAFRFNKSALQIPFLAAILLGLIQIIPFGGAPDIAGVSGISATLSYDPHETYLAVVNFVVLLVYLAAILAFIDNPQRFKFFVYFLIIFGFVYAFYAILQNLLDPGRIYGLYERPFVMPFGSFVSKHNFAAYLEMCIALPLGLMFAGAVGREKRLLFITAIALMGIAMVMSGSRGGLVALMAMLIFLVAFASPVRTTGNLIFRIAAAAALVAAIIAGTLLIGGDSTLTRIAETAESKDPTSNRVQIWTATIEIIKNNPVLGTGWGAYGAVYPQFDPLNGRERVEQAHNDYLQILADAGIIGALIGLGFVFSLFRQGFKRLQSLDLFRRGVAVGALAGCFAVLVHSFFDFVLHTPAIALLFLALAALATINGRVEADDTPTERPKRRKASVTSIDSKRKQKKENE